MHTKHRDEIRYATCWEDADLLVRALDVQPGDVCLSIASAGDNALALLTCDPARVVAVDYNPAQVACLELRVAAYRCLEHGELLELVGARASRRRGVLYVHCRPQLSQTTQVFWDERPQLVADGIGTAGKFERYLALFRRLALRLVHRPNHVAQLFTPRSTAERTRFYKQQWDTPRWRLLLGLFSSRHLLRLIGRDPAYFAYAERRSCDHIAARVRHVLSVLDPATNPYAQWLLRGRYETALPLALRPEHFATIRARLDRLEWHCTSLEHYLAACAPLQFDRFNLSDLFEYMAPEQARRLFAQIAASGRPGARLAYWNMLVPRSGAGVTGTGATGTHRLRGLNELATTLEQADQVPFYSRFLVDEVEA